MNILGRFICIMLIVSITLFTSDFSYSAERKVSLLITDNEPVVNQSREENIPVRTETKVSGWTWLVLALLAVGGGTAYLLSKNKADNNSTFTTENGDASVHW